MNGSEIVLKKLILIEGEEKYQLDTLEELVELLVDQKYYGLTEEEKKEKLYLKAFANCIPNKIEIISSLENVKDFDNKFIALDEITYIYSLLLLNKVILLESKTSEILTSGLDKSKIAENYIIVNHFAKELLARYLKR